MHLGNHIDCSSMEGLSFIKSGVRFCRWMHWSLMLFSRLSARWSNNQSVLIFHTFGRSRRLRHTVCTEFLGRQCVSPSLAHQWNLLWFVTPCKGKSHFGLGFGVLLSGQVQSHRSGLMAFLDHAASGKRYPSLLKICLHLDSFSPFSLKPCHAFPRGFPFCHT